MSNMMLRLPNLPPKPRNPISYTRTNQLVLKTQSCSFSARNQSNSEIKHTSKFPSQFKKIKNLRREAMLSSRVKSANQMGNKTVPL